MKIRVPRKQLLKHSLFLVFGLGLVACTNAETKGTPANRTEKRQLIAGVSADFPPFEYKVKDQIVGYDIDVLTAVAHEMGYEIQFKDMDFSSIIPAINSGIVQLGVGVTATEERKKNILFSEPYFHSEYALITLSQNPLLKTRDLKGKKVGVQLGSTLEHFAKNELSPAHSGLTIVALSKFPTLVQELKVGRLDALVSEDAQAIEFVRANTGMSQVKIGKSQDGYAIALKPGNPLLADFNQALKKLETQGTLKKIKAKWMADSTQEN